MLRNEASIERFMQSFEILRYAQDDKVALLRQLNHLQILNFIAIHIKTH